MNTKRLANMRICCLPYIAITACLFLMANLVAAQDPAISRTQADQILEELRSIRKLLENQQKAAATGVPLATTIKFDLRGQSFIGSQSAPVTIVEFTDFQCPFCQRFYTDTFKEIKKNHVDSGKIRFYSVDLPLPFQKNAFQAAEAGHCATEKGKYWELRNLMQAGSWKLDTVSLLEYGKELGLDQDEFRRCIVSGKYESEIQKGSSEAANKGVQATPAFLIGKSTPGGVEGEMIVGVKPYNFFDQKPRQVSE